MRDKHSILEKIYGYKTFRGGQEALIDAILSGQDALGIMPTGAGKSLCYQIPALLLDGITLVVSPLISLMKDQVAALVQAGVKAAYLNSSLTAAQMTRVLENMGYAQYKLIYVAPERLMTERFLDTVAKLDIALVAVDEAHCVSQWGQDFRPSYLDITRFIEALPKRPTVAAFTATATKPVRRDIEALLALSDPLAITTGFDRENLYFEVQRPRGRTEAVLQFVKKRQDKSGIIYCLTRKEVERICALLQKEGLRATRYHAGLSDQERQENQEQFQADHAPIMVATNAFGMGIDKSNVSYVLHAGMPKNLESYYQEAGRAGRDGAPAECVLFFSNQDIGLNTFLIQRDNEEGEEMDPAHREELLARDKARLNQMAAYAKTTACLRKYILSYFGEEAKAHCGNCFNCKHSFEEADITTEAQKILSCVKRMGERYGKQLVADTLKGKVTGKAKDWGLERLSTYGILETLTKKRILELLDALIDADYLAVTESDIRQGLYPTVKLGKRAKAVLFDGEQVLIRMQEAPPEEKRRRTSRKTAPGAETASDDTLLGKLKALRARLAREQNVPAYIIFSDATLQEMSKVAPVTEEDFLAISGVGQMKLARYGDAFLETLREHLGEAPPDADETLPPRKEPSAEPEEDIPWGVYESTMLEARMLGGMSLEEIAAEHDRPLEDVKRRLLALGYEAG